MTNSRTISSIPFHGPGAPRLESVLHDGMLWVSLRASPTSLQVFADSQLNCIVSFPEEVAAFQYAALDTEACWNGSTTPSVRPMLLLAVITMAARVWLLHPTQDACTQPCSAAEARQPSGQTHGSSAQGALQWKAQAIAVHDERSVHIHAEAACAAWLLSTGSMPQSMAACGDLQLQRFWEVLTHALAAGTFQIESPSGSPLLDISGLENFAARRPLLQHAECLDHSVAFGYNSSAAAEQAYSIQESISTASCMLLLIPDSAVEPLQATGQLPRQQGTAGLNGSFQSRSRVRVNQRFLASLLKGSPPQGAGPSRDSQLCFGSYLALC